MQTAKVFMSGNSQAIRLPKEYRVEGNEVFVKKTSEGILLIPKSSLWEVMWEGLQEFSEEFILVRSQPEPQNREGLHDLFA